MNLVAYLVAIVLFVLAALTTGIAGASPAELAYIGLAFFAAGHVIPR